MLHVDEMIPFTEVGVLGPLINPLANAAIPVFALSTFNTDYLLVKETQIEAAINALANAGHVVMKEEA